MGFTLVLKSFPPKKIALPSKMNFNENAKSHECPKRKDRRRVELHKNAELKNAKNRWFFIALSFEFEDHRMR